VKKNVIIKPKLIGFYGGKPAYDVRGGSPMFTPHFNAFRFYDDDAGEATSAPLANQDTNIIVDTSGGNVQLQLRMRVDETGGADGATTDDYRLDVDINSVGFVVLPPFPDPGDPISGANAGLTNNNATTNRSSDPISDPGAGSFVAGEQSSDGIVDDMQLTTDNFTEHVYGMILIAAEQTDGDTYDFELGRPNAMVNNIVPRITISLPSGGFGLSLSDHWNHTVLAY